MKYITQFDSIRAIAALLVVICHWAPAGTILNTMPLGFIGVNIFFVLSGFLISKILFENRKQSLPGTKRWFVFKNFYARRAFRIFPVYYLLIILIVVFHKHFQEDITKAEVLHSVTYTSNFYIYFARYWPSGTGHFWSLAVEEQFYFLWPLVMLFINQRFLLHAIVAFIFVGVGGQLFIREEYDYTATHTCFDALGLGGLLAYTTVFSPGSIKNLYRFLSIGAILSLVFIIWQSSFTDAIYLRRSAISIISLWLLSHVLYKGSANYFSFVLKRKPLLFLGKLSYGIYLYHYPMFAIKGFSTPYFNLPLSPQVNLYLTLGINFCLLILIAWLSWTFIEKPALSLKKYFPYQKESADTILKAEVQAA
jgi:peptidoglycan/LPS O-acetylase OafA/YrhL